MLRHIQISFTFALMLLVAGLNAQVMIGDGVNIKNGTNFIIHNQEVIIASDEIKGEGNLIISHETQQKITVNQHLQSDLKIQILADNPEITGKYARKFEAKYLPPFTDEIKLAIQQEKSEQTKNQLPIRYINTEGLVYDTQENKKAEPAFSSLPMDVHDGFVVNETMQTHAISFNFDYILPIYSVTLNEKRFSDYAELYEFQSLTAILKPPIV